MLYVTSTKTCNLQLPLVVNYNKFNLFITAMYLNVIQRISACHNAKYILPILDLNCDVT